MLTKEQIILKLEENKKIIRGFGVKKLTLFGSYARNEATPKSDMDFLVEFKKGRGLFDDYSGLLNFLNDLFRKEIDLGEEKLICEELKAYIMGGAKIEARI